ncbi:uncharacterized protein BP5553_00137 [Venustampulla echinocandica]|uniref:Uncharacterized protein n=1 Tax=Venustampulla echinocandica TaxID=2656787 RepID=A0A370TXD9_9HELO|nr:uncharacterized protein BP5553_00137 [Venustampulla echinocandica]RDL40158.1 hypothetical protein BP5553_00137 [Venustampulla echinocandica]
MDSTKTDQPEEPEEPIKAEGSSTSKARDTKPFRAKKKALGGGACSTSWVSPQAEKKAYLDRLRTNASHMGLLSSPFFPSNLSELLEHEVAWSTTRAVDMTEKLMKKIAMSQKETATEVNIEHSDNKDDVARFGYSTKAKAKGKEKVRAINTEDMGEREMFPTIHEETKIWKPNYVLLPEKRDDSSVLEANIRSSWPDPSELRTEGEHRLINFGNRRLPLPRLDRYSKEAVIAKVANGATVKELVQVKGDDIAWYERDLVTFEGLDKHPCMERERDSLDKMSSNKGAIAPFRPPRGPRNPGPRNPITGRRVWSRAGGKANYRPQNRPPPVADNL